MADRIYIFDTTLRDGEQSPGFSMNIAEKLHFADQLVKLNVDIIEAGFPRSSPGDFESVKKIAARVKGVQVAGLARANFEDIDVAWDALKGAENPRIHTFISSSDIHIYNQFKKTREQVLEQAIIAVKHAAAYTSNVEFSPMDATRSDWAYLAQMVEGVIGAGATTVNIPDTVGYSIPSEFNQLILYLFEHVSNIDKAIISVHCHNDLGLATANALAAIQAGARQVECTTNGIGERAGNTAMEEVVMAVKTRGDILGSVQTTINTKQLVPTSNLLTHITGISVQPNKAIVGANAFAHESGIHQDGMLKDRTTYEIMSPESVGVTKSSLVLGKHSGRHAFGDRLKELGLEVNEAELGRAFARFKDLADKKKEISDEDIIALVNDEVSLIPERFKLHYLHFTGGSTIVPTATVGIEGSRGKVEAAACGDGPVDAAFNAIDQITGLPGKLADFKLNAVTGGKDALGEVVLKVQVGDLKVGGRGVSTDIVDASVKAYMNAINKAAYEISKPGMTKTEE
ncbi:MAG: 2-isopropylmalate synthase [Deltaproteobacteria bacterium]